MADSNEQILIKLKALDELTPVMLKALQSMEASTAKMTESLKNVGEAAKNTASNTEGLNGKAVTLGVSFMAVKEAAELAYKAFEKVKEFLAHAIEESIEAEKAFNRMQGALISTGQYTDKLAHSLNDYAEATQAATGASAETIQNIIATGVQMGLSVEKAKELERASRQLAAATGDTLEGAFATMQASLAGQSRALGKVLPEVKELTAAQLKHGDAIDIVTRATKAQYDLYQASFPAALERSKSAIGDVYKAIGNIITQSPLATKAIDAFTQIMFSLAEEIDHVAKYLKDNSAQVEQFMKAFGMAVGVIGAVVIAMNAAAIGAAVLAGAMAIIASPITLVVLAVGALTAAFYKWPGLFDVLVGAVKQFISIGLAPMALAFGVLTAGIGTLVGLFNKDLGASIQRAGEQFEYFRKKVGESGEAQLEMGIDSLVAGKQVEQASTAAKDALEKQKLETSELAKAHKELIATYGGISEGTVEQRKQLELQASQRDDDLAKFTKYLEERKKLAVDRATAESYEVAKARAAALGTNSTEGKVANSQVEVNAEKEKQAQLATERQMGLINQQQYNDALLASTQAMQNAELQIGLAHAQALGDALGTSEAGFQLRMELAETQFQMELQAKLARAQQEGANEDQIMQAREAALQDNLARQKEMKLKYLDDDAKQNQLLGNDWAATLAKVRAAQEREGKLMGTIRGVQQTNEYKGTMEGLDNLSSLRSSKSKEAFELGKKAAIAKATINTFESATAAYVSLAAIPFVGPVLGAAAAAAAIAAGFSNIQSISSQQFSQAHGGLDEVPANMDNSTFLLKGGERVVQPEANKDLTAFLSSQRPSNGDSTGGGAKAGPAAQGDSYNITLNYNGGGSQEDASRMADMVIEQIRFKSERGQPIISSKGVVQE